MNIIKKRWYLALVIALVASLALVGCTGDDPEEPQTGETELEETMDDAEDEIDETAEDLEDDIRDMTYEDILVTPEEAFDTFMISHPDAKVKEFDLDKELMEYQYVVVGYDTENDYEVKIDPVSGEVISDDTEMLDMEDEFAEITKENLSKVDSIIAMAIVEDASDSELDEWNIYVEDGKVIMQVEIGVKVYSYDMETEELLEDNM